MIVEDDAAMSEIHTRKTTCMANKSQIMHANSTNGCGREAALHASMVSNPTWKYACHATQRQRRSHPDRFYCSSHLLR